MSRGWGQTNSLQCHANMYPSVYTFTILVDAQCKEGKMKEAKSVIAMMMKEGVIPNVVTYTSIMEGYCLV